MLNWCDIKDRVELQKYIDNNDLESIITFVNNACDSCYRDGIEEGYSECIKDNDL